MAENHVTLDTARRARLGIDEAVFCAAKTTEQITVILERFAPVGATAVARSWPREPICAVDTNAPLASNA